MSKLLDGIRKKKKFTIFMLMFLMIFMMSSIVTYKSFISPLAINDKVIHSSKPDSEKEKWISLEGNSVKQSLTYVTPYLTGVGVHLNDVDPMSENMIHFLLKKDNNVIYSWDIKEKDLKDGMYVLKMDTDSVDMTNIQFEFYSDGMTNIKFGIVEKDRNQFAKVDKCIMNGDYTDFSMAYDVVSGNCAAIKGFYLLIVSLFILCVALFYVFICLEVKISTISFSMIFILGLVYSLVMPQFSVPDEWTHYLTAYSQSSVLLHKKAFDEKGNVLLYDDGSIYYVREHSPTKSTYAIEYQELKGQKLVSYKGDMKTRGPLKLASFAYIPQTIGMTLARLIHLNSTQVAFMGRIFALLFYAFIISKGIQFAPIFAKRILLVVSLLPMVMQQVCSYNYDSVLFGICFFTIGYLLNLIHCKQKINKKDFIILALCAAAIASIKFVYLPIFGVGLLIPNERFKIKRGKLITIFGLLCVCAIACAIVLLFNNRFWTLHPADPGIPSEYTTYSVSYIFTHIKDELILLARTVQNYTADYISQMIASPLGWVEISMPATQLMGFGCLLILSCLSTDKDKKYSIAQNIWLIILFFGVAFIVLIALQISYTPTFLDMVYGVQGRYFLPVLPLLLLAIRGFLVLKEDATKLENGLMLGNIIFHFTEVSTILFIVIGR